MHLIRVDGVRLAYRVDGPEDAPPLVLINSLGTDYGMWATQVAALRHRLKIVRYAACAISWRRGARAGSSRRSGAPAIRCWKSNSCVRSSSVVNLQWNLYRR
jgi:pimeloyl-ACP methyl ester carboxylesterase